MASKVADKEVLLLLRRRRRHGACCNPVVLAGGGGGFIKCLHNTSTNCSGEEDDPFSSGENAYRILGVAEKSSFSEIKASFCKLAKETHPDLQSKPHAPHSTHRFLQILSAYQILSDSKKRAHYDRYLLSQRMIFQKQFGQHSYIYYAYNGPVTVRTTTKQMEVIEWLKWYRLTVKDFLSRKEMVEGSGYFEKLESEFYSAIHAAYYGPFIDSMDLLPNCFEVEERSGDETCEVLHLVSGRDLFGIVRIAKVADSCLKRLTCVNNSPSTGMHYLSQKIFIRDGSLGNEEPRQMQNIEKSSQTDHSQEDFYKDLELHIAGRVIAVANRMPPKSCYDGINNEDSQDYIRVFLNLTLNEDQIQVHDMHSSEGSSVESRILLGTITGLRTNPEEGSCFVYNNSGTKTHVIMKHRTLMVKHMHWYEVTDEVSACECRCSRAQLPPSKFWLFEPRCAMHDIGGWYVETFGKDKKGKTVPSRRQWYGFNALEQSERLQQFPANFQRPRSMLECCASWLYFSSI